MALILLALGSLLVVPILDLATTNLNYHQLIEDKTLESYSADSGVQYALCELYNNPNQYLDTPFQKIFPLNDRTVDVTAKYVSTGLYQITSTATSPSGSSTIIESYVKVDVGIFNYAITTEENMVLQNTIVDSLPEPELGELGEGNIHSNADIELTSCTIDGDATAVGTITGGTVTPPGMAIYPTLRIQFPEIDSDLYEQLARAGGTRLGDYTVPPETPTLGPLYIIGDLRVVGTVDENVTLILDGTVYVTGEIWVENGNIDGDQTLVAEGNIYIEQGDIRSEVIPIIICTNDEVNAEIRCESGTTVDGVLYAPYGMVWLETQVHLYGAVGAKTVKIESCHITYAKQLGGRENIPGAGLNTISYTYK